MSDVARPCQLTKRLTKPASTEPFYAAKATRIRRQTGYLLLLTCSALVDHRASADGGAPAIGVFPDQLRARPSGYEGENRMAPKNHPLRIVSGAACVVGIASDSVRGVAVDTTGSAAV